MSITRGALGGSHVPATDDDGHATEHLSTFFELREVRTKQIDLTNLSTESDQVQLNRSFASYGPTH